MRNTRGLIFWLALTFLAALFGAQFTPDEAWYGALQKPPLMPPAWIFAPVWSVLYLLMAIAAWRVWQSVREPLRPNALWWFVAQLLVNALWSWLFFGLHRTDWALVDLALLWLLLAITTALFFRRDAVAGLLLIPYLAWISFAFYLNYKILTLN